MRKLIALLLLLGGFISAAPIAGANIEIASYNVQNLFNTFHDLMADGTDRNDWEFLPFSHPQKEEKCNEMTGFRKKSCLETDWDFSKLQLKINQIEKILTRPGHDIPDILGLIEVENADQTENPQVISILARSLGYENHIIIPNGPDRRGINNAILYRPSEQLSLVGWTAHAVEGPEITWPTRDILEAEFLVAGQYKLSVFVNHWSAGKKDEPRIKAAQILQSLIDQRLADPKHYTVVVGDYNVSDDDEVNPIKDILMSSEASNPLRDVHLDFMADPLIDPKLKAAVPPGTFFDLRRKVQDWQRLDRILTSQNLSKPSGLRIELESFSVFNPDFSYRPYCIIEPEENIKPGDEKEDCEDPVQIPFRYVHSTDKPEEAGYSDHFPVFVNILLP